MKFTKIYKLISFLFIVGLVIPRDLNANDILTKVKDRTKGIDHSFELNILKKQKSKPDKTRRLKIWVHWPDNSSVSRMSKVETLAPENLQDVNYWEHRFSDGRPTKRWMTFPVTGKLREITGKKANKNEFYFSELEVTAEIIELYKNEIVGEDVINGRNVLILESRNSKNKDHKKVWVDAKDFFIHKAEFYTKRGRKRRVMHLDELQIVNEMTIPTHIKVDDLKKNIQYEVQVNALEYKPCEKVDMFTPKALKK